MQPIEFIFLGVLFAGAGLLAVLYYRSVPDAQTLKQRLPNRPSAVAVILTFVIGFLVWYICAHSSGLRRAHQLLELVFGLLFFESLFILFIRWLRLNWVATLSSGAVTTVLFWYYINHPSFLLQNSIIIVAILGAATLLIRLDMLKTWYLFVLAALWVPYDIYLTQRVLPAVTVATSAPYPTLLYPAVTVGTLSLGAGDFMFLALFTLVLLRDFGALPAVVQVAGQGVALLCVGLLVQSGSFIIPMMVVLAPIFMLMYGVLFYHRRRTVH
ncbi:MAG: hypothetical protein WC544_04435 [Patescibacteria group bacterium]